ncbi:MAG: aminoacyl-tRNA hydrolase [Anaerolineaceae bacterium]|nr:aminoacyl-tRNA hydrolase [Anaerolineaceae bacterium]
MIEVTPSVKIEENEIQYDFIRASGPGGQNVNKVASSVQLRFDIRNSPSLELEVKERLVKLAGNRVTEDGILIIEAKRYRTQEQNRFDATQRLVVLIREALEKPNIRKATRPSLTAKAARVGAKKRRGATKRIRRFNPEEWDDF